MRQFEYEVLKFSAGSLVKDHDFEAFQHELSKKGFLGWELVSCYTTFATGLGTGATQNVYAVFKREILPKNNDNA